MSIGSFYLFAVNGFEGTYLSGGNVYQSGYEIGDFQDEDVNAAQNYNNIIAALLK